MKTCLVVDDSKVVRILARRILEELNFDVSEAADGKAAIDLCEKGMPDGVLLDWNMPIMSGIEFLQELRQMKGGDSPIVVFCTTENDMDRIKEAITNGANEYIMKPFDTEIIQSKFSQAGLL